MPEVEVAVDNVPLWTAPLSTRQPQVSSRDGSLVVFRHLVYEIEYDTTGKDRHAGLSDAW